MKRNWIVLLLVLITVLVACSDDIKPLPKIISFTATPKTLTAAGDVKLEWVVEDATGLSIIPNVGAVTGSSTIVKVNSSTNFTLTAKNDSGSDTKGAEVLLFDTPPPTIKVDPEVQPSVPKLPDERRLASLKNEQGIQADFIQNELILMTDDDMKLAAFLQRWQGENLKTLTPPAKMKLKPIHLIRINPARARAKNLIHDMRQVDPSTTGEFKVSSQEGLQLLSAAVEEIARGSVVGVNWLGKSQSLQDGHSFEAMPKTPPSGYNPDAATWAYMNSGTQKNMGVADAWQLMALTGRLNNRIRVAVIDGGFTDQLDPDMPNWIAAVSYVPWHTPRGSKNAMSCGGVPLITNSCPWHGTLVSKMLAGKPDNAMGVAGPAGPIADLITLDVIGDQFTTIAPILDAVGRDARIINMSFGLPIPFLIAETVLPFNLTTLAARDNAGVLIFAAAGNDNVNVDASFLGVETVWHTPCENGGVICVGGLGNGDQIVKDGGSNYGKDNVDIFGPYNMWKGTDPDNTDQNVARMGAGTSFASPFVAGIAALIWAADPNLSADDVERILMETANTGSPDGKVNRWPNAFAAVKRALGGTEFFKDRFEINDTNATATPLTPGVFDGLSLHNLSDKDYYKFDFPDEKSTVDIELRYISRLGSLGNPTLLQSSTNCGLPRLKKVSADSSGNKYTLQYEALQGSHTLRVGQENPNYYSINVSAKAIPISSAPDEFEMPIRNDSQDNKSQLGFRNYYGDLEANFDNGQDVDWYRIYSSGTTPGATNGQSFYFDIGSSDVPVTVEVYAAGNHTTKLSQASSSATCTNLPHIPLPDGSYDVKVSSTEYKRGGYVFGATLQNNYFEIPQIPTLRDIKPRPTLRDVQYLELLGQSDGLVFSPPPSLTGIQILGQGFHVQLLDLTGAVLQEGVAISNVITRSSTRAGTNSVGEELSFSGLSSTTKYVLGVLRTDIPQDLTAEEISRLPIISYTLSVLSSLPPDQTPPVAKVSANTSIVLSPETVTITADAKDDVGVDGVLFYEDNQLVSTDIQAPYTLELTYSMLRNGSHTYSAKVIDTSGNVSDSLNQATVGVDISNMILNPNAELSFGLPTESPPVEAISAFAPKDGFTVIQYGSPNGFPSLNLAAQIGGETNFFAGGTASVSSAEQLINVFDGASQIDTGTLVYELSGLLGGYSNQEDHAEVILTFRDGFGFELGTAKLEPVGAVIRENQTNLLSRQVTGTLPVGTRIMVVKVVMTKADASDTRNDGYADNLKLKLYKP